MPSQDIKDLNRDFNYSHWEKNQYFTCQDLVVVGSGIVGLSTAISFVEKNKKARVLVLDRGFLPEGASTKNAGFACFGSAGELLADLKKMDDTTVWQTVKLRWDGLKLLRKRLGDRAMSYESYGGYELFRDNRAFEAVTSQIERMNKSVAQTVGLRGCFSVDKPMKKKFPAAAGVICNRFEGQIDTGQMMRNLLMLAHSKGVITLSTVRVETMEEAEDKVNIITNRGRFIAHKAVIATNGFASELLRIPDVLPARAQVLVTSPLKNLPWKGCFHFEEGFYYFRNVGNRVLFGGGRNLDIAGETTSEFALNDVIQSRLNDLLDTIVLPGKKYDVETRWSGIMGVGAEKIPIVKPVGRHMVAAVRMGGMGVAIGSMVGKMAADLVSQH